MKSELYKEEESEWGRKLKELERKKTKRRENRIKKIHGHLTDILNTVFPEHAPNYEIVAKQVNEYYHSTFDEMVEVTPYSRDYPTYEFYLVHKSNPENLHRIMLLHREDIDAKVKNENMKTYYQIPAFERHIRAGIEKLSEDVEKKGKK